MRPGIEGTGPRGGAVGRLRTVGFYVLTYASWPDAPTRRPDPTDGELPVARNGVHDSLDRTFNLLFYLVSTGLGSRLSR